MKKILIIDTIGEPGHRNFNRFFLELFADIYKVTFLSVTRDLAIPKSFNHDLIPLLNHGCLQSFPRWVQYRRLRFVKKKISREFPNIPVLFLCYETISFSIVFKWVSKKGIYVFEHNNIDHVEVNKIKKLFYRFMSPNISHLCLASYIFDFINKKYGKCGGWIPHPLFETSSMNKTNEFIFAPSSTYDLNIRKKLIHYCERNNVHLLIKGIEDSNEGTVVVKQYFDDYYELISRARFVFLTNRFDYRVSGVAYESLALGKPVVGFASPFLEHLRKQYPTVVKIISEIDDLKALKLDYRFSNDDFDKFVKDHQRSSLVKKIFDNFESIES